MTAQSVESRQGSQKTTNKNIGKNVTFVNNQKDFPESKQVEAPSLGAPQMSQMMDHMMTTMKLEMTKMFQSMMHHRQ